MMSTQPPEINFDPDSLNPDNLPPIAPGPDETVTHDESLEIDPLGETPGRRLGEPLLTRSKQWGLVWRIDIDEPRNRPGRITRAICWNDPSTGHKFVIFHSDREIPPLNSPS